MFFDVLVRFSGCKQSYLSYQNSFNTSILKKSTFCILTYSIFQFLWNFVKCYDMIWLIRSFWSQKNLSWTSKNIWINWNGINILSFWLKLSGCAEQPMASPSSSETQIMEGNFFQNCGGTDHSICQIFCSSGSPVDSSGRPIEILLHFKWNSLSYFSMKLAILADSKTFEENLQNSSGSY